MVVPEVKVGTSLTPVILIVLVVLVDRLPSEALIVSVRLVVLFAAVV